MDCRGTKIMQHYFDPSDRESLLEELCQMGSFTDRELHFAAQRRNAVLDTANDILLPDCQNPRLIQATVMDIDRPQRGGGGAAAA